MEKEKIKKKKLTLSISSKKTHSVPHYVQSRNKTSVVIEKKAPRKWGEKKFQSKEAATNKSRSNNDFLAKKPLLKDLKV